MNEKRMKEQLILHEGIRYKAYKDTVGKVTVGVGRNLVDRGLSTREVDYLLNNDIEDCRYQLDTELPWWRTLSEVRQRVLVDMCFNLGISGLLGFKNTLGFIQAGAYDAAATGMLKSKWAEQVQSRAIRLAEMMRTGQDYAA